MCVYRWEVNEKKRAEREGKCPGGEFQMSGSGILERFVRDEVGREIFPAISGHRHFFSPLLQKKREEKKPILQSLNKKFKIS